MGGRRLGVGGGRIVFEYKDVERIGVGVREFCEVRV
jgi:hypothetical protein